MELEEAVEQLRAVVKEKILKGEFEIEETVFYSGMSNIVVGGYKVSLFRKVNCCNAEVYHPELLKMKFTSEEGDKIEEVLSPKITTFLKEVALEKAEIQLENAKKEYYEQLARLK